MSEPTQNAMIVTSAGGEIVRVGDGADGAAGAVNPLKQVHRLLRGRYRLAGVLCVVGMLIGALVGYKLQKPIYQSTGLIRIKPSLPRILYQNDQNGTMPFFDAFVESQVALIKSQRVIDIAMQHQDWKALGRGLTPEATAAFKDSLNAKHPKNSELLLVTFEDPDPQAAQRAVVAVIDAYDRLYGENDSESAQSRMRLLEERRMMLANDHKTIIDQIRTIVDSAASGSLEKIYGAKLNHMLSLEAQLQQIEVSIALHGHGQASPHVAAAPTTAPAPASVTTALPAPSPAAAPPLDPVSINAMAMQVPDLARMLFAHRELERQLMVDRSRLGEKHRAVRDLESKLEALTVQMYELARFYQQMGVGTAGAAGPAGVTAGLTLEQLRANEASLKKLYERVKAETEELGRRCLTVEQFQAKASEVKEKLDETSRRIDQLNTEAGVGGRISIESRGERPLSPAKDQRKILAAAGALGLGGLGISVVLLMGLFDRRIRHISDVQANLQQKYRVLGVLPMLPDAECDPEQAVMAAHGVHQIRMKLQHRFEPGTRPVLAITSASPGDGKTSLTVALGLSFAASGARTLMIDCDIIGGGLTAKMRKSSRRRIGHILRRLGLITTEQLVASLKESVKQREPIGATLIRNGFVSEADVAHALEMQQTAVVGLREALQGDPANECIIGAGTKNLYLMPLGSAQRQHVAQLSFPALMRVINQVRNWFDVILIDTGPVLGSLEAAVVVTSVDQVVLTVARGEQQALVDRAVRHLTEVGGQVAGVVLNRAQVEDIVASGFSSSASRVASRPDQGGEQASAVSMTAPQDHALRLGPIGNAVVGLSEFPLMRHDGVRRK